MIISAISMPDIKLKIRLKKRFLNFPIVVIINTLNILCVKNTHNFSFNSHFYSIKDIKSFSEQ